MLTELLSAVASGDRNAFATLFRTCQPRMVGYATGLLAGDRAAAEDVVDNAMIAVWQQADRFAGSGSAEGWLRRIVRNKAIDWLRGNRLGKLNANAEDFPVADIPDLALNPELLASRNSDAAALHRALAQLSLVHREAIWLCYFEDKSLAEIAEICGCPENTVKTRLFHARRHLRLHEALVR